MHASSVAKDRRLRDTAGQASSYTQRVPQRVATTAQTDDNIQNQSGRH